MTNKFQDASKHYFEDCMQSPLPHLIPLKVCAMLALANILSKSFLAFVYIGKSRNSVLVRGYWHSANHITDLGLSLAQNLDDPAVSTPHNLQRPDFVEAKRVRLTLLSLQNYAQEYSVPGGRGLAGGTNSGQGQKMWNS